MRLRIGEFAAIALVSVALSVHPASAGEDEIPDPALTGSPQDSAPPRPRSVLFYLIDTCRHDRVGFDGYERKTTPFLEWLAERAVVFETSYSQAPWTKPSIASMLSSQYPSTIGVYKMNHRLPDEIVTWPEHLQANGMYTAGFSANIVMGNTLSNFAQGFDHFTESTRVNRADPIRFASGSAKKLNEHAFAWLDQNDQWPMLLYMHSVDPHEEYEPEQNYLEQFADPERHTQFREEWQKLLKSRPPIPGLYVTQDNFDRTGIDSASFIAHGSNLYDADIRANDDQLQQLWDKLQEDGWGEDFIFVFTSDHGEEFFEHGGTSHGYSLYDEMIRVPLMIYAPGLLPAGKRITTPVRSLDIYPTLCDLLGLETPEGLEGESLVPLINGQDTMDVREVYSEHREDPVVRRIGQGSGVMVSLRSERWKFILNQTGSQLIEKPRFELFDLNEDPGEQNNVADAHPELVKKFELKVVTFVADHRKGAAVKDWVTADPEVLAQLRALGYIGGEEDGPDLWAAMKTRDLDQIRSSLEAGADPNELDQTYGLSALSMAAMLGDLELAKALLREGARIDQRNTDGSTPLSGAAFLGRVDMLVYLLDKGADPDAKNAAGATMISVTQAPWDITEFITGMLEIPADRDEVEAGRLECAALLKATKKTPKDPTARLFAAIGSGNAEAVARSLADGARLEDRDAEQGWTPLSSAVFLGKEEIARLLIEKGAKPNTLNRDSGAPLHAAALMGHVTLVELLLEHGADIDAQNATGSTPLHLATFLGRVGAVEFLLRENADRGRKDLQGQTALDLTKTPWEITEFVMQMLGITLERAEVEKNRAEIAKLLAE